MYGSNCNININIYRANDERIKNFGKSLSAKSRQYRTKRIDVNVKINALAYSVEVLGGFIVGSMAFLRPPTYLYTGTQIWYGIVIPSCYLVNCSDIKRSIMENGWIAAISNLYSKKKPKNRPPSAPRSNSKRERPKDGAKGAHSHNIEKESGSLQHTKKSIQENSTVKGNQVDCTDETYKQTNPKKARSIILPNLGNPSAICHSVEKTTSKNCQNITKDSTNMAKNKDKEVSVFCISYNSNHPLTKVTETNCEPVFLPGQVDYS